MNERFEFEGGQNPEVSEEEDKELFDDMMEANEKENEIVKKILQVYNETQDKEEARRIIAEEWEPLLKEVIHEAVQKEHEWMVSLRRQSQG